MRRLPLALLALLVAAATSTIVIAVGGPPGDDGVPAEPHALAGTDSAAAGPAEPVEDPPCLASRLGLPCR